MTEGLTDRLAPALGQVAKRPVTAWLVVSCAGSAADVALGVPCPLYASTGLYCPACGATRATLSLLRGDVASAIRDNALLLVSLVLGVFYVVPLPRLQRLAHLLTEHARALDIAFGVAIAFAGLRNLPWLAFLVPHR